MDQVRVRMIKAVEVVYRPYSKHRSKTKPYTLHPKFLPNRVRVAKRVIRVWVGIMKLEIGLGGFGKAENTQRSNT